MPADFKNTSKLDGKLPCYVQYKNIHELEKTMRDLGISDDDYIRKYFSINKFKYFGTELKTDEKNTAP